MKKTFISRLSALFATALMAASCSSMTSFASEAGASATLKSASGLAGSKVSVDLVLNTDDMCNGYNFDVEFDSALKLSSIQGAFASEVNGNVATIINLTGMYFKDDKAVTTMIFEIPEDAAEGTKYDVKISRVGDFKFDGGEFVNPVMNNATIDVLESAKKVTNYVVFESVVDNMTVTEVALRGDVNGDGKVDLQDSIAVAKNMIAAIKLDAKQSFCADVNGDGKADLQDLIALCKFGMASDKLNAWGRIIF